jgi:membrane protein
MALQNPTVTSDERSQRSSVIGSLALLALYAGARVFLRSDAARRRPRALEKPSLEPAASPARRGLPRRWAEWKHILYCVYEEINDDRVLALAAAIVFYSLLALFPAITALVSSYALFADPSTISQHLNQLADVMPQSAYGIVNEQVNRIVNGTTGKLGLAFFFGFALALWSANSGVKAFIDALNIVYGVKERRGFIKLNLVSLAFTVGAIAGLLLAIAAIVVLPIVFSYLPLGGFGATLLAWLRWPALFVLLLIGLAVLYRFGPDLRHPRWRWISPGAAFAAITWLVGSALLSLYLSNFAHYDATYGSLGAAIGLMMWLWLTGIVVLVGAEFNVQIDAEEGAKEGAFPQRKKDR